MTYLRWAVLVVFCGLNAAAIVCAAPEHAYSIDSSQSRATIEVGKSGVLSFAAGHTHEVVASRIAGTIIVDSADPTRSTGQVMIDASALRVTGKSESESDVPKVQATMLGAQVLDVEHYPTITFTTTSIAIKTNHGTTMDVMVTGRLTLHNVTRSIAVPVTARIEGQTLTATGRFSLKQTDYGIEPVSVGGVVSVKNTLNISFNIVGR